MDVDDGGLYIYIDISLSLSLYIYITNKALSGDLSKQNIFRTIWESSISNCEYFLHKKKS